MNTYNINTPLGSFSEKEINETYISNKIYTSKNSNWLKRWETEQIIERLNKKQMKETNPLRQPKDLWTYTEQHQQSSRGARLSFLMNGKFVKQIISIMDSGEIHILSETPETESGHHELNRPSRLIINNRPDDWNNGVELFHGIPTVEDIAEQKRLTQLLCLICAANGLEVFLNEEQYKPDFEV